MADTPAGPMEEVYADVCKIMGSWSRFYALCREVEEMATEMKQGYFIAVGGRYVGVQQTFNMNPVLAETLRTTLRRYDAALDKEAEREELGRSLSTGPTERQPPPTSTEQAPIEGSRKAVEKAGEGEER